MQAVWQRLGLQYLCEYDGEGSTVSTRKLCRGVELGLILQRGMLNANNEPTRYPVQRFT